MRRIDSQDDVTEGLAALARMDGRLVAVIDQAGPVPLRRRPPGYQGLAEIIVAQMVSKASANAIWTRLVAEAQGCEPQRVARLSDIQCRRIGLSRAKEATLKGAAVAVLDGAIDPQGLCGLPADEAISAMTAVKGIGPWTAEVYLLFCAGHADIFPAGDVALQGAAGHALGLAQRPDQRTLRAIAGGWQPWRGVAARLFWAYYATAMRRGDVVPTQ
jgi:DNA-3-methyladenine glycosylase II